MKRFTWMFAAITLACGTTRRPANVETSEDVAAPSVEIEAIPPLRATPGAPVRHTGSSIATDGVHVWVADEPHRAIFFGPVPSIEAPKPDRFIALGGRPAQIVRTGKGLLVTVREPGRLLFAQQRGDDLVVGDGVPVPFDAWGVAVDDAEKIAVVTSAWSHAVSVIDLESRTVRATLDVAREPRGVVIVNDRAYVSHLTSASLTRIDDLAGTPTSHAVDLPAAPLRTMGDAPLDGSLGYALAASSDRVFAARHALGAMGIDAWFGASTVDVLLTKNDTPLAVRALKKQTALPADVPIGERVGEHLVRAQKPLLVADAPFVQPRDMVLGDSGLWVVGEGNATLALLDARAISPSVQIRDRVSLGSECMGPSGVALLRDEAALVHCATTFSIARVDPHSDENKVHTHAYATDPLPALAAEGRRAFVDASDTHISGGLGCAGCHPEGRDDGHVWSLVETTDSKVFQPLDVAPRILAGNADVVMAKGRPRQTPMLAGRVFHPGPYGWNAQAPDLESRIEEGLHIHRWHDDFEDEDRSKRVAAIAAFLRAGLVAPVVKKPLGDLERRGKQIFESREAQCAFCHEGGGSDNEVHRVDLPARPGFLADDGALFKTPSLRFVSGTAPYFHDGSAATLRDVLRVTDDGRMGHTGHLSESDKRALLAYLSTL